MNLFDKLPENFFSILSRKYKAVYAFSLTVLFECLKTYKTSLKKSDYISSLRSNGETILSLFDVNLDRLDDRDEDDDIGLEEEQDSINAKTNYIFRKLVKTGWIDVERDIKTNVDMLFLPSYAIKMMKLIEELSSDTNLYIPLVHQTYSELSLENEKEDDYMFRSLASARKNADELELNVTLLHHSICVFGHNLTQVFDPNEALRQHFDIFREQIGDKLYHPMKTYDSLGLYSLPVINILRRWQRDKRIMSKLVTQAKFDPSMSKMKTSEVSEYVNKIIQETIDIYMRLNDAFDDIDKANSNYTLAVQRKVNFLSNADKTIKGKLDNVILRMAKALDKLPVDYKGDYSDILEIQEASNTINLYRQGFVNSDSLYMPFKRGIKEDMEPMPLEDELFASEDDLNAFFDQEVSRFSQVAIEEFMMKHFKDQKSMESSSIELNTVDDLVLLILGTVRAQFGDMFYSIEKIQDQITDGHYRIPNYKFTKKGR